MSHQKVNHKVFKIPKRIIAIGKFLQFFSYQWAARFVFKLFTTPYRFSRPDREMKFYQNAEKELVEVPEIHKKIVLYHVGNGQQKVLLIHGWAGRGSQMYAIADFLVDKGYRVTTFDGPAHGDSDGKVSAMPEFTASILAIQKKYGNFDYAMGHSLGGMALLNAVNQGFNCKKIVLIASGNSITSIVNQFVSRLELKPEVAVELKRLLDKRLGNDAENLSAYKVAKNITVPVLILHDEHDEDVPVACAKVIKEHIYDATIHISKNLGHRKILYSKDTLQHIAQFIN